MIVFVESNFVLEIALLQEESDHAAAILDLALRGRVDLRIPSLALCEPFTTLTRRRLERDSLLRSVEDQ